MASTPRNLEELLSDFNLSNFSGSSSSNIVDSVDAAIGSNIWAKRFRENLEKRERKKEEKAKEAKNETEVKEEEVKDGEKKEVAEVKEG